MKEQQLVCLALQRTISRSKETIAELLSICFTIMGYGHTRRGLSEKLDRSSIHEINVVLPISFVIIYLGLN